jgi:hypothetical protein
MLKWMTLASAIVLVPAATAQAIELTSVSTDVASFDPAKGEVLTVRFRLSEPARVALRIYDARDILVREVRSEGELAAGDGAILWDGLDLFGRRVPPEAYTYTVEARVRKGETVLWDLGDSADGQPLQSSEVTWDPARGSIQYLLPQAARVRIRVGIENDGPLLQTLIDWVPRRAGLQLEEWNGKDASGLLDLSRHPALAVRVEAFSLAPNTVHVIPTVPEVQLIADLDPGKRRASRAPRKARPGYADKAIELRRDFPVRMELRGARETKPGGALSVDGPVSIRIDVEDAYRARVEGERFEAVYFVDGRMLMENEVGFLPMTWSFDPSSLGPGEHHLSVNLRTYEGQIGVQTIAVHVDRSANTASSKSSPSGSGPKRP